MKKSLITLAVLSSFTGVATAASSVTLYGTAEVAYQDGTRDTTNVRQAAPGESRVGFKGNEDLGHGMAAIFQLESRYNISTGANTGSQPDGKGFFDEQSWVGLSFANGIHKVRFGKTNSPLDRIGNDVGHLVNGLSVMSSMGAWRNGIFYDYSDGGLTVALGVTTKGGAPGDASAVTYTNEDDEVVLVTEQLEGQKKAKPSYGISAKYKGSNWYVAAGWQADNDKYAMTSPGPWAGFMGIKNEWQVNAGYTFKPVTVGASYARAKLYGDVLRQIDPDGGFERGAKRTVLQTHISAALTPMDTVFINYGNIKGKGNSGFVYEKQSTLGLGYTHNLSKRTSVFAGIARAKTKVVKPHQSDINVKSSKETKWDVGLKHSF